MLVRRLGEYNVVWDVGIFSFCVEEVVMAERYRRFGTNAIVAVERGLGGEGYGIVVLHELVLKDIRRR